MAQKKKSIGKIALALMVFILVVGIGSTALGSGGAESQIHAAAQESTSSQSTSSSGSAPASASNAQVSSSSQADSNNSSQAKDSAGDSAPDSPPSAATLPEGSSFSVTFLDVGQGDSAIVQCDGHYMIVDGGPADASSLLYAYLSRSGISHFDYMVATHPDTDHTGGLSGALQIATVGRAFCSVTEATQKSFNSMVRYLGNQGVSLEVPSFGDTFSLGSAQVTVVGPASSDGSASTNGQSIMLRIDYGNTSVLLTGDATEDEERASVYAGVNLAADVLKVAHHGSAGSSCYAFLREAMPTYAVISVGDGNTYGHPTDAALSRLRDCGAQVFRTDIQGDVTVTSDGETVNVSVEKNTEANTFIAPGAEAASAALSETGYIGNRNSKKFHLPTCRTLPAEKNRVYFDSRDEAASAGYSPCGNCKP